MDWLVRIDDLSKVRGGQEVRTSSWLSSGTTGFLNGLRESWYEFGKVKGRII